MISLKHADIERITGGVLHAATGAELPITGCLEVDSRRISHGDIFVAHVGESLDGHDFLPQAQQAGASVAIVTRVQNIDFPQILVDNATAAMHAIAKFKLSLIRPKVKVIGITGSNGKTTTKNILGYILSKFDNTVSTLGNQNNEIGFPITVSRVQSFTKYLVLEYGAVQPGDITLLRQVAEPDVAVLLSVGHAHVEKSGDLDNTCRMKAELVNDLAANSKVLLNYDDPRVSKVGARNSYYFGFDWDSLTTGVSGDFCREKRQVQPSRPAEDEAYQAEIGGVSGLCSSAQEIAQGEGGDFRHGLRAGVRRDDVTGAGDTQQAAQSVFYASREVVHFRARDIKTHIAGTSFVFDSGNYFNQLPEDGVPGPAETQNTENTASKHNTLRTHKTVNVKTKLIGKHHVANALAALSAVALLGLDLEIAASAMAEIEPPEGRMQHIPLGDFSIIHDAYNASFESAQCALESLALLGAAAKRRIAVLGRMHEMGHFTASAYATLMRKVSDFDINLLIIVADEAMYEVAQKIIRSKSSIRNKSIVWFKDLKSAICGIHKFFATGDLVLFKASNAENFSELVESVKNRAGKNARGE